MATLVAMLVLGGGGSPSPRPELLLELLAAAATIAWLWQAPRDRPTYPRDPRLLGVAAIVAVVPVIQLLPLPPSIWNVLPGRETASAALGLVGADQAWRPVSLAPLRTFEALLSLGPPIALLLMAGSLGPSQRRWLIGAVAGFALFSALLGAGQLAGGAGSLRLYENAHPFGITGFQANRNAEADILLIGLIALGAFCAETGPWRKAPAARWSALAAGIVLVLAVLFTGSRSGIALLPIALLAAGLALGGTGALRIPRRIAAICAGGVLLGIAALLRWSPALAWVTARFETVQDPRFGLWQDSAYAAAQFWPFGSGMGTFGQAILAAERLEAIDPTLPNRAHNDFLELALEAGIFGAAALIAGAALICWMTLRAWRRRPGDRAQIIFGFAALSILAAHSCLDYPLRSMAVAALAGLAAAALSDPAPASPQRRPFRDRIIPARTGPRPA